MLTMEDVVKRERKVIKHLPLRLVKEVNKILLHKWGREILHITPDNGLRLMTLWTWMDRYLVDLEFVMDAIVPYHMERVGKKHRKNPRSIGFQIGTMVGKTSELLLREAIEREFPNGEHVSLWQWSRIQDILRIRRQEGGLTPQKTMKQCNSLAEYVEAYKKRVQETQKEFTWEQSRAANTRRHYRTNPWV